jgi:DNA-binding transcriptional MerR regulator
MTTSAARVDMHQIGEVAERVGLSLRTVRYYEEKGLISPQRTDGGFRLYTDENIARLLLIMQMKPLGFSLDEMREVLDARDALAAPDCGERQRELAQGQLTASAAAARKRIAKMRRYLASGEELVERLSTEGRNGRLASGPS